MKKYPAMHQRPLHMVKTEELDDASTHRDSTPKMTTRIPSARYKGCPAVPAVLLVDRCLTFHNPCLPSVRPVASAARFHSRFQIDEARSNDEIRHRSDDTHDRPLAPRKSSVMHSPHGDLFTPRARRPAIRSPCCRWRPPLQGLRDMVPWCMPQFRTP